jgi:hypothetical protein
VKWIALGVEVAVDRSKTWAALAGLSDTGRVTVDLCPPLVGAGVAVAIEELWEEHELESIGLDPGSPSSTLVAPLQAAGMPLKLTDARAMAAAHGGFVDLLGADRLRIRGHGALDAAVRVAESRRLAGAAAVERYGSTVDMAPAVAAELAVWALGDPDSADGLGPDAVGVWVV